MNDLPQNIQKQFLPPGNFRVNTANIVLHRFNVLCYCFIDKSLIFCEYRDMNSCHLCTVYLDVFDMIPTSYK